MAEYVVTKGSRIKEGDQCLTEGEVYKGKSVKKHEKNGSIELSAVADARNATSSNDQKKDAAARKKAAKATSKKVAEKAAEQKAKRLAKEKAKA